MSALATKPSTDDVWGWLEEVPDPEIPAVSVVDLGIVRDVDWKGDTLVVTVTPTYSGCPATSFISRAIEMAIRARGVDDLKMETRISPAWTTDWISDAGRENSANSASRRPSGARPPAPARSRFRQS
ncbi:MAG: iron-sulfur cluster assembly protein [Parvularculaceae bacterium]